ncbi:ribbon-helix-helix domain-containing protein [Myxococcota bacterium]
MSRPKKPGRPRTLKSPRVLTLRLPATLIKRIDSFAKRRDAATRSEAVRYLVTYALDQMAKQDRAHG